MLELQIFYVQKLQKNTNAHTLCFPGIEGNIKKLDDTTKYRDIEENVVMYPEFPITLIATLEQTSWRRDYEAELPVHKNFNI